MTSAVAATAVTITPPRPCNITGWVRKKVKRRSAWVPFGNKQVCLGLMINWVFTLMANVRFIVLCHPVSLLCDPDTVHMEPLSTLVAANHEPCSLSLLANAKNFLAHIFHSNLICSKRAFSFSVMCLAQRMWATSFTTASKQKNVVTWKSVVHMILSHFPHVLKVLVLPWVSLS